MKIAMVRIRGKVDVNQDIADTLDFLHLKYKNNCNVVDDTPNYMGMIQKVKDYITFGEVERETFEKMLVKRGIMTGGEKISDEALKPKFNSISDFADAFFEGRGSFKDINLKQPFRLTPPTKGFERAGIKKPFSLGGALGNRKKKINELLLRMI